MDLFSSEEQYKSIKLDYTDADLVYYPCFISSEKAFEYFEKLKSETDWKQDPIKIFGKEYLQPRLTALYGKNEDTYSYSGITMHPSPLTTTLNEIFSLVEGELKIEFTTVLLNLYRDGTDSNGWHSDDEKELGVNPIIASLSLGTDRVFQLRHKKHKKLRKNIELSNGSLLLMKGKTQHFWQHQIPKSKKITTPRINLTFRIIE